MGCSNQRLWIAFGIWFAVGLAGFTLHGGYTIIDSLYLMVQIITTVGYGDFGKGFEGPETPIGYIFMTIYILMSVMVLASLAGAALGAVVEQAEALERKRFNALLEGASVKTQPRTTRDFSFDAPKEKGCCARCLDAYLKYGQAHENFRPFIRSTITWLVTVAVGVVFWCNYPHENLTVTQAIYMCVVTLSTVGFGDFHPQTQGGKLFATVWMLVGCTALADMVTKFSVAFADSTKYGLDKLDGSTLSNMADSEHVQKNNDALSKLMQSGAKTLTDSESLVCRSDFILYMLKELELVDDTVIQKLTDNFDKLDVDQSGFLTKQDLADGLGGRNTAYQPPLPP